MNCATSRELISAQLDGETSTDEQRELDGHLASCRACREYAVEAAAVHRAWRVRPAPDVPDLTDTIMADLATQEQKRDRRPTVLVLRIGLALLALAQLLVAGPELVEHADSTDALHALHHLNAWALAFAVGLAVVAWQPWRVHGLLPLAGALGGLMAFTVVLDVVNRHAIPMPATEHVIEVVGIALLWLLARCDPSTRSGGAPAGQRPKHRRAARGWRLARLARGKTAPATAKAA
jgi:predicted anti-sigma-YlaC factor YlaD